MDVPGLRDDPRPGPERRDQYQTIRTCKATDQRRRACGPAPGGEGDDSRETRSRKRGVVHTPDGIRDDTVADDTALACRTPAGLVIITGCSHAGICSIIEQAREVCDEDRIADIVGGFHLLDPPPEQMQGILNYFSEVRPGVLHPCHCTGLAAKIALAKVADVRETGVGLHLENG